MTEEGLRVVLTPPQLAAVLADGTLEEASLANRAWGAVGAIFGAVEIIGGGALLLIPEPTLVTKVGGSALGVHGFDTLQAGVRQAWSGLETDTLTSDGTTALAQLLGVSEEAAERLGDGVDILVPVVASAGLAAARIAAVRGGKISLAAHEAHGGHTIARHVARSETQLRARLAAEPHVPVASTFVGLAQAERAVAATLQANRAAIASWARTASTGGRQSFEWTAREIVGNGVIRATGKLVEMRKIRVVLKKEAFNGKLYYVLTAFPIP